MVCVFDADRTKKTEGCDEPIPILCLTMHEMFSSGCEKRNMYDCI